MRSTSGYRAFSAGEREVNIFLICPLNRSVYYIKGLHSRLL